MFKVPAYQIINFMNSGYRNMQTISKTCFSHYLFFNIRISQFISFFGNFYKLFISLRNC